MHDNLAQTLEKYSVTNCLVAVSGGVDSMALSFLLSKVKNIKFKAIIIDHNLRESSVDEAKMAQENLHKLGIESEIIEFIPEQEIVSNIEAKAREGRYQLLSKYAKDNNYEAVLLAHHQDDIVENFFIRLTRGSGIDGLAKMEEKIEVNNIQFLRPLLDVRKSELKELLIANNISWVEDPTNKDQNFLRNKIRHLLHDLLPDDLSHKRIMQTSEHCRRAQDFLELETIRVYDELVEFKDGEILLSHDDLLKLHEEISLRLLVRIFTKISGNQYKPRFVNLQEIVRKLSNLDFIRQLTFANCLIRQKKLNKKQYLIFSLEQRN